MSNAEIEKSLSSSYAPGQLPFCHDKSYRLRLADRELCTLGDAELQRCPALKQACSVAPKARQETQEDRKDSTIAIPPWVSMLAELALWALLGALVIGIVMSLLRMRRARDVDDSESTLPEKDFGVGTAAAAPAPPAETDVERLLSKARQAADRGELGEAIDAAHAAAMQGLSAAGHLQLERDRTNGDYLRELRKAPPLHQDFKLIVGQVEAAQFGGVQPSRGNFDQVFERVTGMLRRLAVLTVLLVASFSQFGCGKRGSSGVSETQETSPSGLYAFKRLLIDQGVTVHTRVAPLAKLDEVTQIVVFPAVLEPEERDHLLSWVESGGVLISVGNSEFDKAGQVERRYESCGHRAQLESTNDEQLVDLKLVVLGRQRMVLRDDADVGNRVRARCGAHPYVVSAFIGAGAIHYFPEEELFSNASLSVGDNALLLAEIFQSEAGETVELVGEWTGNGSQSPLQSLKAAGMLPFMLQLLALGLLLALRQGTSFGARRDDTQRERRAFADHVRAVASTYHRAGAGRLVSGHYSLLLMEQLRERVCPGQSPTLLQLAAAIARRSGRREPEIVELLVDAKGSLDEGIEGQGINHKVIRELEQLSLQVGGIS